LPIAGGDVGSAHQNLAGLIELHLAAFQYLADRTLACAERMVEGDQRSGFSQAVTLNDDKAEASPELFGFGIERGAARDEGPELPTKLAVNAAKTPPAADEMLAIRRSKLSFKPQTLAGRLHVALNFFSQRLHEARHGHHDRNALLTYQAD